MGDTKQTGLMCIGTCLGILIIIFVASAILDFDPSTSIENNTTITLNDVHLVVPASPDASVDESATLSNVNDTEKFGIERQREVTEGNAKMYNDPSHGVQVYVADADRTAYSDEPDSSETTVLDGDRDRTHIEKKNVGDKVVVVFVTEGKGLSRRIIESAEHV